MKEQPLIVINMPGGGVQDIDESDLFWLRKAFDSEWKGATMLQLAADRIYSNEPIDDLSKKFEQANVPLAEFSAPESAKTKLLVSAQRVRQVIDSDPVIYNEKAESVLIFPTKLRLAVRETPDEARKRLKDAGTHVA
ncbi:hypothetical protein [Bradyrhizobium sp. ARR65]|uniref:hypothetical protein n=1 Tax=Bradyrhizobium sp. ARR65 TaxID=1040989 RepID=UPI000465FBD4|nr:hypothetical protein [Bradyrhizobium sp. ARR65]